MSDQSDSEATNDNNVTNADEGSDEEKIKPSKVNSKKGSKKKTVKSKDEEEVIPENRSRKGAKSGKNKNTDNNTRKNKIPLLDQPAIIEGSRNRKTVLQPGMTNGRKVAVSKFVSIEIPKGKGTPLGQISNINSRLIRLRVNVMKNLHRFIFGKLGNQENFIINFQRFNGFPFEKESDPYMRKLKALKMFPMQDLKNVLFFLDLGLKKLKKKDDMAKEILDFLVSPNIKDTQQSQPIGHPKRKATKRNYKDLDVNEIDAKKKKKAKVSNQENEASVKQNGNVDSRRKTKNSEAEPDSTKDEHVKQDETDADKNNELKKPAKKRKRNQIVEEPKETKKETKTSKKNEQQETEKEIIKTSKKKEQQETGNETKTTKKKVLQETEKEAAKISKKKEVKEIEKETKTLKKPDSQSKKDEISGEVDKEKTDLSDEELRIFLQKLLANANLEETTMKTVYDLIRTHYPKYNFGKKKDFIKEIVKSLIQS